MTTTMSAPPLNEASRAKRLKALTHEVHENVDRSIMSAASFASLERYVRFLAVQSLFHHDVAALYEDTGLQALFPDRSEEHTYEIQSLMRTSYAVFCLKKKN